MSVAPTASSRITSREPSRRRAEPPPGERTAALEAVWASDEADVRAAQRLRWLVFAEEMGAEIQPGPGGAPGLDVDAFDAHCEHLLVRTVATDDEPAHLVGTYRLLTPDGAQRAGGWYTATEFDLGPLAPLSGNMVELGRSCVAAGFRSGGVILMLWASLGQFMHRRGVATVMGCSSIPMHDGGVNAAAVWRALSRTHLASEHLRVQPRLPLPVDELPAAPSAEIPPLIKGYLRCGGKVLGPPAWDPAFQCADLPMLLRWDELSPSYRRHFVAG